MTATQSVSGRRLRPVSISARAALARGRAPTGDPGGASWAARLRAALGAPAIALAALTIALAALTIALAALAAPQTALAAGASSGQDWHFEPVTVQVEPIQVSPRVYYVLGASGPVSAENQGFNANAAFVVTDDGVVVFDALGSPSLGEALIKAIRSVTEQPIRRVVISHYHSDHFYGLQAFKALTGADVWAGEVARRYLATEAPRLRLEERRNSLFPWVDENTRIVEADRWIGEEEAFSLGGIRFELKRVGPAHTNEDLAMYVVDEGVLLIGDLMFAGRIPFVGNADTRAWLAAIEKVIASDPKILVGGHGSHTNNAREDLALTREYLLYLRQTMGEAVDELLDFEEAYARTDWSRFSHLPAFEAGNRLNAYNVFLGMQRELLTK
ncbi:MAG: MBL fold metallo-hydrolase [Burkholderiales bacterium]|nr:MAG: MBL fold metallo-hydrolase [Burkholderiales bacterium]